MISTRSEAKVAVDCISVSWDISYIPFPITLKIYSTLIPENLKDELIFFRIFGLLRSRY